MNTEKLILSALNLHPCDLCPRIASTGALAGAAHDGEPSPLKEALIEILVGYRRETPKKPASRCRFTESCGLPHEDVTCFLRPERATPIDLPTLAIPA